MGFGIVWMFAAAAVIISRRDAIPINVLLCRIR